MNLPLRDSAAPPGPVLLLRRTGGWHHQLISVGPSGQKAEVWRRYFCKRYSKSDAQKLITYFVDAFHWVTHK
jgi:hypothetical protein